METRRNFVALPEELLFGLGKQQKGTRIFRREGGQAEQAGWFDLICTHVGPCVSPGGVAMYAAVTRAGVYKRMNAGLLTAFCFHVIEETKPLFGRSFRIKATPFVYIPVEECKAWKAELEGRMARLEAEAGLRSKLEEDLRALRAAQVPFSRKEEMKVLNDPADRGMPIRIVKRKSPKSRK